MAQRKEDLNYTNRQQAPTPKRSRITIDITPELRRRIKLAAFKRDLSVGEYVGDILEEIVPKEESITEQEWHPVSRKTWESLQEIREEIMRSRDGKPFEDSTKMIRQMREERTQYLLEES